MPSLELSDVILCKSFLAVRRREVVWVDLVVGGEGFDEWSKK